MTSPSLLEVLADVPDPRSRHGQIHPLSAVLGLVALAMLQGRTSLTAISRFGRQHGPPLAWALGFRRGKTPTVSTLSRTLRRFDAGELEAVFARWIEGRVAHRPFEHISLDGRTLRGSRDGTVPGVHLVAAYAPHVQAVLRQVRVDAKTNEHKAALELLGLLPVRGKVVVGDAMFCQRDVAAAVADAGGDYVLFVKGNQKALKADIEAGLTFEDSARRLAAAAPPPDRLPLSADAEARTAGEGDKGHGRRERRTLRLTPVLTVHGRWKGLRQGFRLTRERTVAGQTTVEVAYGITTLTGVRGTAKALLKLTRDHWAIENSLHYVRDVTLREDACRVRSGSAPQVLAAVRNAVVYLLSGVAAKSRPEAIEYLQIHPDEARSLIGIPQPQ